MFFNFDQEKIKKDIEYILQQYFPDTDQLKIEVSQTTKLSHQARIMKLLNYRHCTEETKKYLQEKANHLTSVCPKPIYIFRELVNNLDNHRFIIPGYSALQIIVGKAVLNERERLVALAKKHITKAIQLSLEQLFSTGNRVFMKSQ